MQSHSVFHPRFLMLGLLLSLAPVVVPQAKAVDVSLELSAQQENDYGLTNYVQLYSAGSSVSYAEVQDRALGDDFGIFQTAYVVGFAPNEGPGLFELGFSVMAYDGGTDVRCIDHGTQPNNATWDLSTNSISCPQVTW